MTIETGMHPAIAAAKADLVYDANDDLGWPVTCFFSIRAKHYDRDRSTGDAGGWQCDATLIGCQIGDMVLDQVGALKALVGDVKLIERVAGEYESERRNDEDAA